MKVISLKRIWTKSIARQLMLGIALVHAVLMTIFVVDLVGREKKFLIDLSKKQAIGLAKTLAANGTSWVLSHDIIGIEEIIKSQSDFPGLQYAMLLDTKGKVLGFTDITKVGTYINDEISQTLLHAKSETYSLIDNSNFIDIATPIFAHKQHIGWARVGISRASINNNLKHFTRNGLLYTFVAILIGTIFAWFMARGLTTDIRKLVSRANRLQKGEGNVEFILDREDELGKMAENFQDLSDTLLVQLNSLKREIIAKEIAEKDLDFADKKLSEEKEMLSVTLRSIGDGVITTDLDGNITLINKCTEALTGWTQQGAVGRPIQEVFNIFNEKTGQPCENPVKEVLATGKIVDLANHTALIARNGTRYIIEDSGAPIFNKDSQIIGAVLVYRDVTEERKTAEELLKVKKLESVGVLAGGIAHDFNNILAAILGNIELASIYTDSQNEAFPLLKEAIKASLRAQDLTQQLLTFAKGGDPVKQTSSIDKIIIDSANFVLHGSSVVCDYNIPDDLWPAEVDSGQISQVIQNIIINARQAMPEGGVVEVCCQNITDITQATLPLPVNKYIKITLVDSGTGIPAKYIDKIFDPYFSTRQEGSGLGLAICHSIISKHGGNISVQSEANKGTKFTIYLPASRKTGQDDISTKLELIETEQKATIMVMDDESQIRNVVKRMLSMLGHEVLQAENGHEAIEIYNKYHKNNRTIDIIIMDLTIPGGMGGKDTVQEILKINPKAKVIVASGYATDPVMTDHQAYGFTASISKPFQLTEFSKLINETLQQSQVDGL